MGLAGVKKSTRIGIDPRNTKWINNENGVGHKLLAAQGWTPGQGLGDSMKGRTVNIKTVYKDDTAGIGCTPQHSQEWSGLGAFNDIFTRINTSGGEAADVADPGLKNPDRVVFMETKAKRIGLDVRFVKGETFTSELSRQKFLESLGISITSHQDDIETDDSTLTTEKERKRAKKLAKAARREARAAKRAEKDALKMSKSKSKRKSSAKDKRAKDDQKKHSRSSSPDGPAVAEAAEAKVPAAVVLPAARAHGRFASRAKYQRAKLGGRMDAAQLAEILGVKA